jgi:hypothetical protein
MSKPRGIRNNNPMNIRLNPNVHWQGQSEEQTDGSFVQFVSPEMGIRAGVRILRSYARQGINTISGVLNRYAPPSENDTTAYVDAVCKACNKQATEVIDLNDIMMALVKAIIWHECGDCPYTPEQIASVIAMA